MAIRLTITDRRAPESEHFRGFVQSKVVFGRARICDVCLPDLSVSAIHAELRLENNVYSIIDLSSLNGTAVEGRRLIAHRPRRLQHGDVVDISEYRITFEQGAFAGTSLCNDDSTAHARDMLRAILADSGRLDQSPVLVAQSGPCRGARFPLVEEPAVAIIGRAREHEIRLEDVDVSRVHAEVRLRNGVITVRDLASRNGVIYGGNRCAEFELAAGQTFTVGNTVLGLENPVDPALFAIQNAPEEETSSFSVQAEMISGPPTQPSIPVSETVFEQDDSAPEKPLPIGPKDPLLSDAEPDNTPSRPSKIPVEDENTDMGLIVVGAMIVIATVAALIWLLT